MLVDLEYLKTTLQNEILWGAIAGHSAQEVAFPELRAGWTSTSKALKAFTQAQNELRAYFAGLPSGPADEVEWSPWRLKQKIQWEGGLVATIVYGIEASLITEPELARLWQLAADAYRTAERELNPLEAQIKALIVADLRAKMTGHAAPFQYDPVWTSQKLEACDLCGRRDDLYRFSWLARCHDCNRQTPVTVGSDNPEPNRCGSGWIWGRCARRKDHPESEHDFVPYTSPDRA
jgi:hypothetical protein